MARNQFNVRLPQATIDQIQEIVAWLPAESQAHAVMVAVERLHQELQHRQYPPKCEISSSTIGKWTFPNDNSAKEAAERANASKWGIAGFAHNYGNPD